MSITAAPSEDAMRVARDFLSRKTTHSKPEEEDILTAAEIIDDDARVLRFQDALRELVAKLDECTPHIDSAFGFCHVHGQEYDGPSYGDTLRRARDLLEE